jgi:hypothetical protein
MGERSAVRPKSGQSVSQSDPGLRRPTPPVTAGRKPAARPPISPRTARADATREAGIPQPKIGRGAGQSPAALDQREALGSCLQSPDLQSSPLVTLDKSQIRALADFIKTLDRWDREAHGIFAM